MKFPLSLKICLMSLFWRIKPSNKDLRSVGANSGSISVPVSKSGNAKIMACFVSVMFFSLILDVSRSSNISQIVKTVVLCISIYMVNIMLRPFSGNIKPSKSAGPVSNSVNSNDSITVWTNVPSLYAGNNLATSFFSPRKNSSFGAIVERLAEVFNGKLGASHV